MRIKRIILFAFAVLLIFALAFVYNTKFRLTDSEYRSELTLLDSVEIRYDHLLDREVRHVWASNGNDELLILVHGSPSSSAQWTPLVNDSILNRRFDFLLIDRPGYGFSDFGNPLLSIEKQASIIQHIISQYDSMYEQRILLGTSYGGSVAARLMMDYPGYVDGGILMSSSLIPGEERIYNISYPMDAIPWLFPRLVTVANEEKLNHEEELSKMSNLWHKVSNPVLFIHGKLDDLIYPDNVYKSVEKLGAGVLQDTVWVHDGEHSLYWSHRELVKAKISQFLKMDLKLKIAKK